ncbi:MAG: prolipoprotein diacylglyceryl transferase [Synergistaceae bacterium]|jgi:phosphatidylglycerol:prolipoprotein diacylglycerol transferase|nr:prolipoprotein diacylglyceryl transferase [Synergistaceae bacterium]
MLPVLFRIGPLRVESYYVIWGLALAAMVIWTRSRAEKRYAMDFNDVTGVLQWVMAGVLVGATAGGYIDNWSRYAESPIRILYIWESGLSSGPGFIGGGLAGLYKLRKLSLSVNNFAEAASVPCALLLFVGRWGCFLNGCCQGIATNSPLGVRFLRDRLTPVYPTQLFESFAALAIGICLWIAERKMARTPEESSRGALLWPSFLMSYGLYRVAADFLRSGDRIFGLRVGQYTGGLAFVVGVAWMAVSLKNIRLAEDGRSAGV